MKFETDEHTVIWKEAILQINTFSVFSQLHSSAFQVVVPGLVHVYITELV